MRRFLLAFLSSLLLSATASACDSGDDALFACDAANSTKFIELCASEAVAEPGGYLMYRFGEIDAEGARSEIELEFPTEREGSLGAFFGATYKHEGIYTQSVRFESGQYSYTVFTEARGMEELGAGVHVLNRKTGKVTTVDCSERPRFYIFELQGVLACDPETPAGRACIE